MLRQGKNAMTASIEIQIMTIAQQDRRAALRKHHEILKHRPSGKREIKTSPEIQYNEKSQYT